MQTIRKFELN